VNHSRERNAGTEGHSVPQRGHTERGGRQRSPSLLARLSSLRPAEGIEAAAFIRVGSGGMSEGIE
jgi:hypothetical protein